VASNVVPRSLPVLNRRQQQPATAWPRQRRQGTAMQQLGAATSEGEGVGVEQAVEWPPPASAPLQQSLSAPERKGWRAPPAGEPDRLVMNQPIDD
jgi:hypothetical protein